MKKLFLVALAFIILAGAGVWYYSSLHMTKNSTVTSASSPAATSVHTSDTWVKNNDLEAFGLVFEYPYATSSSFEPKIEGGPRQKFFQIGYVDNSNIMVVAARQTDPSLNFSKLMNTHVENTSTTYYTAALRQAEVSKEIISSTTVDGLPAMQITTDCKKVSTGGIKVQTAKNGVFYELSVGDVCKNPHMVSTLKQLIDSVHFK